jgi:hypothetical protein
MSDWVGRCIENIDDEFKIKVDRKLLERAIAGAISLAKDELSVWYRTQSFDAGPLNAFADAMTLAIDAWKAIPDSERGFLVNNRLLNMKAITADVEWDDIATRNEQDWLRSLEGLAALARDAQGMWKRKQGSQGKNRTVTNGPPLTPLDEVHSILRAWWKKQIPRSWNPIFDKDIDGVAPQNSAAKLFLAVAREVDPRYVSENCSSVRDRLKRRNRNIKPTSHEH